MITQQIENGDVAAFDAIMASRATNEEGFPSDFVDEILKASNQGNPLVPIWRKYRGLTQAELAKKAGVTHPFVCAPDQKTQSARPLVPA